MSLAQHDRIDLVTLLPNSPRIALIAYDGGEVPDAQSREDALQKKLVTYLQFVVSGQFARTYAQFLDRELCILVVCSNPPTAGMKKIEGIRDHAHSETFLPVEVISDAEFRERLAKASPEKPKPGWKFW
jgi:hypothetical protein